MKTVLYVFGLLTDQDVDWMVRSGIRQRLATGEVLIAEGDSIGFIAILLEGALQVATRAAGPVARLGAGEIVGEMSLVDSSPTSATILAAADSTVLLIDRGRLLQKLAEDDAFGSRFYRALAVFLADRLRGVNSRLTGAATARPDSPSSGELNAEVLDRVSAAGERFSRLLKQMS
jgi:CRP-like cAMP-binding protein